MNQKIRIISKYILLFLIGGLLYGCVEVLFRGRTHISMLIVGGIDFILIGLLNEIISWDVAMTSQMILSTLIIDLSELISGIYLNIYLGLNVWDYSDLPYNFLGQVSLEFSVIWFFFSLIPITLDDYLRYKYLGEEKPHYKIL